MFNYTGSKTAFLIMIIITFMYRALFKAETTMCSAEKENENQQNKENHQVL